MQYAIRSQRRGMAYSGKFWRNTYVLRRDSRTRSDAPGAQRTRARARPACASRRSVRRPRPRRRRPRRCAARRRNRGARRGRCRLRARSTEPLPSVTSRPPDFDELLDLRQPAQPMPPVMSSDSAGVPKLGVCAVFLKGIGPQDFGMPWICSASSRSTWPYSSTSYLSAQLAGADVLVAHVDVRNVALVERIAHPADRVGVGPRHPQPQARRPGAHAAPRPATVAALTKSSARLAAQCPQRRRPGPPAPGGSTSPPDSRCHRR